MNEVAAESVASRRVAMLLLAILGVLALTLAAAFAIQKARTLSMALALFAAGFAAADWRAAMVDGRKAVVP